MNNVELLGRFVRDPEIHYATGENANASCRFTLAVPRNFKNAEGNYDTDFISCVAFRQTAEFIHKYFHQGNQVCVSKGRIQTGSYTNRDGQKVYTTDVVVETVEFVGSKSDNNATSSAPTKTTNTKRDDFMNIPNNAGEELPF